MISMLKNDYTGTTSSFRCVFILVMVLIFIPFCVLSIKAGHYIEIPESVKDIIFYLLSWKVGQKGVESLSDKASNLKKTVDVVSPMIDKKLNFIINTVKKFGIK